MQVYINSVKINKFRSILANFRCGTLPLEIETGRMNGVDRKDRLCRLCKSGEIEDEYHFLLTCSALTHIRDQYINNVHSSFQSFTCVMNSKKYRHYQKYRNVCISCNEL